MFSVFSVCHSVCLSTVAGGSLCNHTLTCSNVFIWDTSISPDLFELVHDVLVHLSRSGHRLKGLLVLIFGHMPVSFLTISLWFLCGVIHLQYYSCAKSLSAFFLKYRAILCNISLSQGRFQIRLREQGRTCYCASCLRCNGGNRISEDRYIM